MSRLLRAMSVVAVLAACEDAPTTEVLGFPGQDVVSTEDASTAEGLVSSVDLGLTDLSALDTAAPDVAVAPDAPKADTPDTAAPAKARLVGITVTTGPIAGGTVTRLVTVGFGTDFTATIPTVTFGSDQAAKLVALSPGIVEATTPPHAGGTVSVTLAVGGETATLVDAFTYVAEPAKDRVVVSLGGGVQPGGAQLSIPIKLDVKGAAKPAALFLHVKHDPLLLPLGAPTPVAGDLAKAANKELIINTKKPDGVRVLVLGKNRDVLGSGTLATFFYPVPPTKPGLASLLSVVATAVDPFGTPIPVEVESGFLGVAATPK